MEGITRAIARIDSLRSQLGVPVNNGSFQAVLDAQVDSLDLTATPLRVTSADRTNPFGTVPVTSSNGAFTAAQLDEYVSVHRLEDRNGRLDRSELQSISGGLGDRDFALIAPAAEAYERMRAAAAVDGVDLRLVDAYRSWESQAAAYEDYLAGRKDANVLPPGTSEHGKGMAVDFSNGAVLDQGDPEWQWLEANARSYGWYGISNEAWHWEFRGVGA